MPTSTRAFYHIQDRSWTQYRTRVAGQQQLKVNRARARRCLHLTALGAPVSLPKHRVIVRQHRAPRRVMGARRESLLRGARFAPVQLLNPRNAFYEASITAPVPIANRSKTHRTAPHRTVESSEIGNPHRIASYVSKEKNPR